MNYMPKSIRRLVVSSASKPWLWLSMAAAFAGMAGSIISLSVKSIYSNLTPAFLPQALAQDIASLAVVSLLWLILTVLALILLITPVVQFIRGKNATWGVVAPVGLLSVLLLALLNRLFPAYE
jgi:hypothetical protein